MYDNQGNKVCSLPLCQYGTPCNNDSDCATGILNLEYLYYMVSFPMVRQLLNELLEI